MPEVVFDGRVSSVLAAGEVVTGLRTPGVEEAVERLLIPSLRKAGLDAESARNAAVAVVAREKAGSTCMGIVAIPHARVPGLKRIVGGMGLNGDGVYEENGEIRIVLAFATPASEAVAHLKFLAKVAELFRLRDTVAQLLAGTSPEAVLEAIRAREK